MWNDEMITKLSALWVQTDVTAAEVAARLGLGRDGKNAVIGKARRLGLPPRRTGKKAARASKNEKRGQARAENRLSMLKMYAASPRATKSIKRAGGVDAWIKQKVEAPLPSLPAPKHVDMPPLVLATADLEKHHCRWIPGEPGTGYCGQHARPGQPYCDHHHGRSTIQRQPPRGGHFSLPKIGVAL